MDLKKILAVSGKGGLFKVISEIKSGFIAESLVDHKRIPVYASDKISNLEEISVYTDDKEVLLKEIFKMIYDKESGRKAMDGKLDEKKLKEYFGQVLPAYDKQRVYVSDMKKIVSWYNILHDNQMLVFGEEEDEKKDEAGTDEHIAAKEEVTVSAKDEGIPPAADESEK